MHRPGFTLIEVMIAAVILAGAVLGMAALIPSVTLNTEVTQESNLAMAAAHQMAEAVRQYADDSYAWTWRAYNDDASDDPSGIGSAPGSTFTVSGLVAADGSLQVGTVAFYLDETATDDRVGLPKDLDGDGAATSVDVSTSYTLMPFTISVDWLGRNGLIRHLEVSSQAVDY